MRLLIVLLFISCSSAQVPKTELSQQIDQWHDAAARADFDAYFSYFAPDAVFIGTEATENWNLQEFKNYSKPHFDKGKAWSFSTINRNIYNKEKLYYFDELLNTQMGICRGSGVFSLKNGKVQIHHYVLSIDVPNDHVETLTNLKSGWDTLFIQNAKK